MSTDYIVGEVYFRVTYPDAKLCFPQVESFVFVGRNLSDEDLEDAWYFQFLDSYARSGSILEPQTGQDRRVSVVQASDLGEMLDIQGLVEELTEAKERRSAR